MTIDPERLAQALYALDRPGSGTAWQDLPPTVRGDRRGEANAIVSTYELMKGTGREDFMTIDPERLAQALHAQDRRKRERSWHDLPVNARRIYWAGALAIVVEYNSEASRSRRAS